jgi:hypothetical protein
LRVSWCGTPSLTREWVWNVLLQLRLSLVTAVTFWSKSYRTHTIFYCLTEIVSKSELYYDFQPVGQSVLMTGTHLGPATNFSPSFFNYVRQSRVCWCGAPSLTRGRVCSFQLSLSIASVVFLWSWSWN